MWGGGGGGGGDIIMLQSTLISSTDLRQKKGIPYNCKNVPSKHETQDLTQSSFLCLLAYSTMSSLCKSIL